jgi:hypothetical protein
VGATAGGIYDPLTDVWVTVPDDGAPIQRTRPTAAFLDDDTVLVFGGNQHPVVTLLNNGGLYDVSSNTWAPFTPNGPLPSPRRSHAALVNGDRMFVWGGEIDIGGGGAALLTNTGSFFEASQNRWITMTTTGAPIARRMATMLPLDDGRIIVVGGSVDDGFGGAQNGAFEASIYDPVGDTWTPLTASGTPCLGDASPVVLVGDVITAPLSCGGANAGARYSLSNNTWTPTTTVNAPPGRFFTAAVPTARGIFVFGGTGEQGFGENAVGAFFVP